MASSTDNTLGPLSSLISGMNLGAMLDDINMVLLNPNNIPALKQAVEYLGYSVPSRTDNIGVKRIKLLYWGVHYLKLFPIPSMSSANCGQIQQTLSQLAFEQVKIKQNELDNLFTVYTAEEWNLRQQAVSDIYTKFNGMYAQLNCTASQTGGGNDLLKNVLIITGSVFGIAILWKMFKGKKATPAVSA